MTIIFFSLISTITASRLSFLPQSYSYISNPLDLNTILVILISPIVTVSIFLVPLYLEEYANIKPPNSTFIQRHMCNLIPN